MILWRTSIFTAYIIFVAMMLAMLLSCAPAAPTAAPGITQESGFTAFCAANPHKGSCP